MFEKNNNHTCSSPADIVSYLYGETSGAEKRQFESHIADCQACTDAFAGLSDARFSVYEWNRSEFLPLETPVFLGPWNENAKAALAHETTGWFERIRHLVSGYPSLAAASGVFAAVILIAGIAFFALNGSGVKQEVTATNDGSVTPPKVENSHDNVNVGSAVTERNLLPDKQFKVASVSKPDQIKSSQAIPVKAVVPYQRQRSTVAKNTHVTQPDNSSASKKAPHLSDFAEEEDNTVRLSDLFAEVDRGK